MNIKTIVEMSLKEDIGFGDITTNFLDLKDSLSQAEMIAKQQGILAGIDVARTVFETVDSKTKFIALKKDGEKLVKGDVICRIEGKSSSLLKAERVALNFLQRMSGIASKTNEFVEAIKPFDAKLLDTRKTTPLLRELEKYSVVMGGGFNHRFGLFDMIMLKENHIRAAGSITEAVNRIKLKNTTYKIEVEVTNLEELDEAVKAGVDRVMLDNMSTFLMKEAVDKYKNQVELEASGNVTLQTINSIAATGVDYISSGALTHSYNSLDISLLFKE